MHTRSGFVRNVNTRSAVERSTASACDCSVAAACEHTSSPHHPDAHNPPTNRVLMQKVEAHGRGFFAEGWHDAVRKYTR